MMVPSLLYTVYLLLVSVSVTALQRPDVPRCTSPLEKMHQHHHEPPATTSTTHSTPLTTTAITRRSLVAEQGAMIAAILTAGAVTVFPASASTSSSIPSISELLTQIQQAQSQLDKIPTLIETEKWDSVRAILITPPLSDCWAKTNRPLVSNYAERLGDAGGDELAALEAREELVSHLRYLDMAVYNNVFNPIKVEGKSGATKELIRSYYEDPMHEFQACQSALQELVGLSKGL